jgi:hypothetical protein
MRLTFRLSLLLILGVGCVSLAFAFYQTRAETLGLHHDLERHSLVLAESLAKSAEPLVEKHSFRELQRLAGNFQDREQIAGVAIYNNAGEALATTAGLQARLASTPEVIQQAIDAGWARSEFIRGTAGPLHVAALPLRAADMVIGALAIFHDASYIDYQAAELWRRALIGVAIQTLLIVGITLLMLRWGIGRPLRRMTRWL